MNSAVSNPDVPVIAPANLLSQPPAPPIPPHLYQHHLYLDSSPLLSSIYGKNADFSRLPAPPPPPLPQSKKKGVNEPIAPH
ncbi:hypothetical protein EB796_023291 [Bugula neritina]|uniref:Uncharacterized protein n=1 Tax=Bugula neritina TaxID=10212 RepID=A0A7J7IX16_BUGNE|nr:hypothetical protein EB796_023291 [Bugula neritina]